MMSRLKRRGGGAKDALPDDDANTSSFHNKTYNTKRMNSKSGSRKQSRATASTLFADAEKQGQTSTSPRSQNAAEADPERIAITKRATSLSAMGKIKQRAALETSNRSQSAASGVSGGKRSTSPQLGKVRTPRLPHGGLAYTLPTQGVAKAVDEVSPKTRAVGFLSFVDCDTPAGSPLTWSTEPGRGDSTPVINLSRTAIGRLSDIHHLYGDRVAEVIRNDGCGKHSLRLEQCGLHTIEDEGFKALVEELGLKRLLLRLNLENNRVAVLPRSIAGLSNLTVLTLKRNVLTSLPPEIGELRFLKTLDVEDNLLQFLPLELSGLFFLTTLAVAGNPIEQPPPRICDSGITHIIAWLSYEQRGVNYVLKSPKTTGASTDVRTLECDQELEESRICGNDFLPVQPRNRRTSQNISSFDTLDVISPLASRNHKWGISEPGLTRTRATSLHSSKPTLPLSSIYRKEDRSANSPQCFGRIRSYSTGDLVNRQFVRALVSSRSRSPVGEWLSASPHYSRDSASATGQFEQTHARGRKASTVLLNFVSTSFGEDHLAPEEDVVTRRSSPLRSHTATPTVPASLIPPLVIDKRDRKSVV
eukprot:TRINITY_DN2153_c0_g1_i1.p1 TRINITY_DN2153_c0_g1~~TRINITY_DN2153_c0_g1_i1.p1  ORF type:complete len:589 (-),score=92.46 TRINITY_DN2153_c0_g1_i1:77-1843(-)